jgi:serine/threonine protein kinase
VETGRIIQRRYLLQQFVKQGQVCAVYQGFDHVLQRAVAVKVVPPEYIPAYRAAIKATSQFSHPNIVGIYDVLVENDLLYLVQEFIDGSDFSSLLQTSLTAYQVAEMGAQMCLALLYAGAPSRKVSHGDLTPDAVLRDRYGTVRINNFALPSDIQYFTAWSVIGRSSDGVILANRELPEGQMTEERRADDTRAVGLLLYQLLAGRAPGATTVEPPADGRLRFMRNVPPELCELVARSIIRQHAQYIASPDMLYKELKALAETLEPPPPPVTIPASSRRVEEFMGIHQFSPAAPTGTGKFGVPGPVSEPGMVGAGYSGYRPDTNARLAATEAPVVGQTVQDVSMKLAAARQAAYPVREERPRRINMPALLGIGLMLFILFFIIGYFLAHAVFP